ncbi:Cupredoxin [Mycena floridula]|nr:Cupredoxin [Mycena floridula]
MPMLPTKKEVIAWQAKPANWSRANIVGRTVCDRIATGLGVHVNRIRILVHPSTLRLKNPRTGGKRISAKWTCYANHYILHLTAKEMNKHVSFLVGSDEFATHAVTGCLMNVELIDLPDTDPNSMQQILEVITCDPQRPPPPGDNAINFQIVEPVVKACLEFFGITMQEFQDDARGSVDATNDKGRAVLQRGRWTETRHLLKDSYDIGGMRWTNEYSVIKHLIVSLTGMGHHVATFIQLYFAPQTDAYSWDQYRVDYCKTTPNATMDKIKMTMQPGLTKATILYNEALAEVAEEYGGKENLAEFFDPKKGMEIAKVGKFWNRMLRVLRPKFSFNAFVDAVQLRLRIMSALSITKQSQRRWIVEDDQKLQLFTDNRPVGEPLRMAHVVELAEQLDRTTGAVYLRLVQMNVKRKLPMLPRSVEKLVLELPDNDDEVEENPAALSASTSASTSSSSSSTSPSSSSSLIASSTSSSSSSLSTSSLSSISAASSSSSSALSIPIASSSASSSKRSNSKASVAKAAKAAKAAAKAAKAAAAAKTAANFKSFFINLGGSHDVSEASTNQPRAILSEMAGQPIVVDDDSDDEEIEFVSENLSAKAAGKRKVVDLENEASPRKRYCDGLRGPLVIYDDNDPHKNLYDVDDESTIITLADWYHQSAEAVFKNGVAVSDSTLINGKGRWNRNPTADLAVVNVQHGKRYRFRLISMSCEPNYVFSINSHKLTVIEADGISVQPLEVDTIQIFAAQRYSFILNANQKIDNYWIRANPNFANATGFANGINSAILRYSGAKVAEPSNSGTSTGGVALDDTQLHPLSSPAAPGQPKVGGADVVLDMHLSFDPTNGRFLINNETFRSPSVPVLLQVLSGKQRAQDLLPKGSVYGLPRNKVIEINLIGGDAPGGPHPFHLHGHAFSVTQSAGRTPNFKNPVRRDVTEVVAGKTTTIRFVTDNPGPWILHCHIDFHLEAGFAVVLAEDAPDTAQANPVPADWKNLCPLFDHSNQGY